MNDNNAPNTIVWSVYQLCLCLREGEEITSKEIKEAHGNIGPVSSAMGYLCKLGILEATHKVGKQYVFRRTAKPEITEVKFNYLSVSNRKSPRGVTRRQKKHALLPPVLEVKVDLHSLRYMTSIGW